MQHAKFQLNRRQTMFAEVVRLYNFDGRHFIDLQAIRLNPISEVIATATIEFMPPMALVLGETVRFEARVLCGDDWQLVNVLSLIPTHVIRRSHPKGSNRSVFAKK